MGPRNGKSARKGGFDFDDIVMTVSGDGTVLL